MSGKPDVEFFKRMVRLLDLKRRTYLAKNRPAFAAKISPAQFHHLMLLRFVLPCNLARIMAVTSLTSAGASLFVDKLVQSGVLTRRTDPDDRRNVIIGASPQTQEIFQQVDKGLNELIDSYFDDCTPEELSVIERAGRIICSKIG